MRIALIFFIILSSTGLSFAQFDFNNSLSLGYNFGYSFKDKGYAPERIYDQSIIRLNLQYRRRISEKVFLEGEFFPYHYGKSKRIVTSLDTSILLRNGFRVGVKAGHVLFDRNRIECTGSIGVFFLYHQKVTHLFYYRHANWVEGISKLDESIGIKAFPVELRAGYRLTKSLFLSTSLEYLLHTNYFDRHQVFLKFGLGVGFPRKT